ncbi:MAG: HprK-related kinase A [Azoarcus sp.]|nr:HprK-related kinase A [Azoarcus sp.]MDX9837160.1 HprK-related kinase A [Azoarcus sp.]
MTLPILKLGELTAPELKQRLTGSGLWLRTGEFVACIHSRFADIQHSLSLLYADHPLADNAGFADFHISIENGSGLRRYIRPQAQFVIDGVKPFQPLPANQAFPILEWGMNWCITAYGHHQLVLHAAAVARDDRCLILPAPPGSGKSTLCAALVNRGWRLLSDELTLIDLRTGAIHPLSRPVSLKNNSIGVIKAFAPDAVFSRATEDTSKGTVALMKPPRTSVEQMMQTARPRWIVMPKYVPSSPARLDGMGSGEAFLSIADNAMNYHILGTQGFKAAGNLIDECSAHRFEYSNLDEAIATFDQLAREA